MGHRDLLVPRTYLRQTPNARVCPREASAGRLSSSGVSVHYLADEHWSGSVTETSLPDFPFFSPVSGWPEGISGRPRPNVERSMLGAGEKTSHANDAGFGAGRSGIGRASCRER